VIQVIRRPLVAATSALQAQPATEDAGTPRDEDRGVQGPAARAGYVRLRCTHLAASQWNNEMADALPSLAACAEFTVMTHFQPNKGQSKGGGS
jgi:hypothetical protein